MTKKSNKEVRSNIGRNWQAIAVHFRNSSGSMKTSKKDKTYRSKISLREIEDLYEEDILFDDDE